MAVSRTPIPHSQRVALRRYYQTTNPKPTHSALRVWFKSRFGYNISQSIVSRSLSDSFAYLDVCATSDSEYRTRNCQWPWIETLLTDWLQELEARIGKVSNSTIERKAKQLWEQSDESEGLAMPKFSTSWVVKFRRRHNLRLQPHPEQAPIIVTPDQLSGEISFSQSHGSSADTHKQAAVSSPPQSKALTTITYTNNTSLNREVDKPATLTFSSDHLIHLIQHNSYRALMSNKSLLLAASLILEASDLTESIKQFATKICGGLTIIRPLIDQQMPNSLYPTQLQMNCAHTSLINGFPFPKFRDNLIKKGVDFVPEEMCRDLFGDIFPDYITPILGDDECTLNMHDILSALPSSIRDSSSGIGEFEDQDDYLAGRRCLITWGDPWRVENWEVTPGFLRKWGWSLEGCDDLIRSSNRWRALRNEALIPWIPYISNST